MSNSLKIVVYDSCSILRSSIYTIRVRDMILIMHSHNVRICLDTLQWIFEHSIWRNQLRWAYIHILIMHIASGVQVRIFESLLFVSKSVRMYLLVVRNFIFYYCLQNLCLVISDNRCSKYHTLQISIWEISKYPCWFKY